jgi:hypothetical protein
MLQAACIIHLTPQGCQWRCHNAGQRIFYGDEYHSYGDIGIRLYQCLSIAPGYR